MQHILQRQVILVFFIHFEFLKHIFVVGIYFVPELGRGHSDSMIKIFSKSQCWNSSNDFKFDDNSIFGILIQLTKNNWIAWKFWTWQWTWSTSFLTLLMRSLRWSIYWTIARWRTKISWYQRLQMLIKTDWKYTLKQSSNKGRTPKKLLNSNWYYHSDTFIPFSLISLLIFTDLINQTNAEGFGKDEQIDYEVKLEVNYWVVATWLIVN